MHERSYWWRPEDHSAEPRSSLDRPYWWRDDDLPFHHDEERSAHDYDDERRERFRDDRGDEDYDRHVRHRRDWGDRAADRVKAALGSERAERRLRMDHQRYGRDDRREHYDRGERRDFRGVGPRTGPDDDDELREEISARLRDDPDLDASDIRVRVLDNEAILDGSVHSRRDAEHAQHLADDVRGVVFVRNRLRVERGRDGRVRHRRWS